MIGRRQLERNVVTETLTLTLTRRDEQNALLYTVERIVPVELMDAHRVSELERHVKQMRQEMEAKAARHKHGKKIG